MKFCVNCMFYVPKTPVSQLHIQYMGGIIRIIFNTNQRMDNRSLFAKFQVCSCWLPQFWISHIYVNIHISRKIMFIWDQFEKNCISKNIKIQGKGTFLRAIQYNAIFWATPVYRVMPSFCFQSCGACEPEQT